jgi:hypothetical protein
MTIALMAARADLYGFAFASPAYLKYVRQHGIDVDRMSDFAGASALAPIVDCGGGRFDWPGFGQDEEQQHVDAFIVELFADDGETVLDIVAWPVDRPQHVMSMFGRAALAGEWEAFNPATFYMGKALVMHRTVLDWLKAGCRGAAIVDKRLAARALVDVPGPVAARDRHHAQELIAIIRSLIGPQKIVVATDGQKDEQAA